MTETNTISAVIIARNEEEHIAHALSSLVKWVDEIVFFDMASTDRTVSIAQRFGVKLFHVEPMGYVEPARMLALSKATGKWIILLDADEVVSPALRDRLVDIAENDRADVVKVPRENYFFGAPLRGTGCGPNDDRVTRFFKMGHVKFYPEIHSHATWQANSRVLSLTFPSDGALVHFGYEDITQYISKLNRYTDIESRQVLKNPSFGISRAFFKAAYQFCFRYFVRGGYRDGWRGFYISVVMIFYSFTIWAKKRQTLEVGSIEDIKRRYAFKAEEILSTSFEDSAVPVHRDALDGI